MQVFGKRIWHPLNCARENFIRTWVYFILCVPSASIFHVWKPTGNFKWGAFVANQLKLGPQLCLLLLHFPLLYTTKGRRAIGSFGFALTVISVSPAFSEGPKHKFVIKFNETFIDMSVEYRVRFQPSQCVTCKKKRHFIRGFYQYFRFPMSLSFYQCCAQKFYSFTVDIS